jgi:carbon monoxide dehydrogenase subunit G
MKLENTFTVAAPLERTWATLLDIERVAGCLPGARIEPTPDDGVFRGAMKIKLGPMTVDYRGTARLQDVDEDTHTASIAVQAREANGSGTAAAVISNRLEPQNGHTRIVAETELNITGRQAQFGRGIMEDVAQRMMGEFAKRLEAEIGRGDAAAAERPAGTADERPAGTADERPAGAVDERPAGAAERPAAAAGGSRDDVLDVGNVLARTPAVRYAGGAAATLLLALLARALLRPRRQITLNLNLRR